MIKEETNITSSTGHDRLGPIMAFLRGRGLSEFSMAKTIGRTYQAFHRSVEKIDDMLISCIMQLFESAGCHGKFYFYDTVEELEGYRSLLSLRPIVKELPENRRTINEKFLTSRNLDGLLYYMKTHKLTESAIAEAVGIGEKRINYMFQKDDTRVSRLISIAKALKCNILFDVVVDKDVELQPEEPAYICRIRTTEGTVAPLSNFVEAAEDEAE